MVVFARQLPKEHPRVEVRFLRGLSLLPVPMYLEVGQLEYSPELVDLDVAVMSHPW